MSSTAKRHATYADIDALPENVIGEIVDGDLTGWRRERLAEVPADHRFTIAPDWLCEVLSPGDKGYRRIKKMRTYLLRGIAWVWLVDPLQRTLEALHLDHERWVIEQLFAASEGDDRVRAEPFAAVELELSALWSSTDP